MDTPITDFAPAQRAAPDQIRTDNERLGMLPLVRQLLNSFPQPAMILNLQRQIVYGNDRLLELAGTGQDGVVGHRVGELLNCVHSRERDAGCGTSKSCSLCGIVNTVWQSSRTNTPQVQECRINCRTASGFASLDLRAWGTPLTLDGQFTILAIQDITDEKRRTVLERVFFTDVLDLATGLNGILEAATEASPSEMLEMNVTACNLSEELLEAIRSYRDLIAAERGELRTNMVEVEADRLLCGLCDFYARHSQADGKIIAPPVVTGPTRFQSDPVLLSRVLGHLMKNALEASAPGESVRVSFENAGRGPTFHIHNSSYMSEKVQLQIFQRSFTTKAAAGRGIGTYAVRLLTERYLGGEVSFTSTPNGGTVFTVRLIPQPGTRTDGPPQSPGPPGGRGSAGDAFPSSI